MSETLQVTAVHRTQIGTTDCWLVEQARPDGTTHIHAFPTDTLTWRAAEYGIDPTDTDTLLDIVLHEPHMPDDDRPQPTPANRDTARADLLAQIADAKANHVRVVSPGRRSLYGANSATDPLDLIRHHTIDPDRARAIHDHVNGQGHTVPTRHSSEATR